jgi:hypothetical protein
LCSSSWIDDGFTPSWIIYPLILLVGLWRMWRGHGTLYFGIAARVLSAASWLARLGCVARPVPVRGLTQQRRDEALAKGYLEVGLSAADPFTRPNRKGPSPMMLIGIDPHMSTHTATAIAPDANHAVASIRIDATLSEHRRMLTWARQWPQRRWAVENA